MTLEFVIPPSPEETAIRAHDVAWLRRQAARFTTFLDMFGDAPELAIARLKVAEAVMWAEKGIAPG